MMLIHEGNDLIYIILEAMDTNVMKMEMLKSNVNARNKNVNINC